MTGQTGIASHPVASRLVRRSLNASALTLLLNWLKFYNPRAKPRPPERPPAS